MSKRTNWITIPEETFHTPVSQAEQSGKTQTWAKKGPGQVKHKFFWSVGFVVVMIASFAVLAPQKFGNLIQGNLFDAPGVEAPTITQSVTSLGILPTGTQAPVATEEAAPITNTSDETVVQPENTPVSIQVAPITQETSAPATVSHAQNQLDANQQLILDLKKQIQDLKTQQPAVAQATTPLDLRGAAPEAANTTALLGQTSPEGYRLNSHRVTVSPQTVLQQYLSGGYRGLTWQTDKTNASGAQVYRADLGNVRGTPDTGPREVLMATIILTFISLLGWKAFKLYRR